ncbi:tyrosine-type recombinase/integrase [Sphingomonas sp. IW22]|uniref:tyrosine-type recombinase/integrase n=1 Tax=Sphingomonas sp. IW22 TaxID=3242489 RepID=UPI003521FF07
MLTNAAVKSARPRPRAYKLFDGGGLHLFVAPTGLKSWRLKYRIAGREKLLVIGQFPDIALDGARARRDQARAAIAIGEDPARSAERLAPRTLEQAARAWFEARRERWSIAHAADVIGSLERHIFPRAGARAIAAIDAAELLELLESIEGAETARRVRQRLDAIFAFARPRGWVEDNPAALIAAELAPPAAPIRHPAVTTAADARSAYRAIASAGARPIVNLAAQFLALTAVRVGSLRLATWEEIEIDDAGAPLWRIPAAHLKLSRARKASADHDHLVPLSRAARAVLEAARGHSGEPTAKIFPIGERAIGELHDRAGLAGRHVPHGWRASFSTVLNEAMPDERVAIDEALAHQVKGKVESAYNRAEQLARRRALFDAWATVLTG